MNKEELEHNHIKEIAENYVNECWGTYLDLDEVDLVMAGIGVGKIIASEQEKRIAELEKENAENESEARELNVRFDRLIKENAELKETLKTYNGCSDWDNDFHTCRVYLQREELQDYIEQLTKAKKLIKTLLVIADNKISQMEFQLYVADAKQFLSSEVEK